MKQSLIVLFLLCFLAGVLPAQDSTAADEESAIKLLCFVDRTSVPLNRTVTFTIRLQWSGDLERYEIHKFDNPLLENFEIVGNASSNRVLQEGGNQQAINEYEYILKPGRLGMGYIEGVIIKYTDLKTDRNYRLITNRLEVKVEDPLPEPGAFQWQFWLLLALILLLFAALGFFVMKKRQQRRLLVRRQQQEAIPTEQKYLNELETLNINQPELDTAQAYSTISRLLKSYLAEKGIGPGLEATTGDIMQFVRSSDLDEELSENINQILSTADLYKFSGSAGDRHQVDRIYALFEKILEKNKSNQIREDK
ncbi:hypothetical protein GF407_06565 [candidate division KSB1 bacterium]|nr:hypothetical protein [candidate division KSB1 bacterium]